MQIGMRQFSADTMAWLADAAEAGLGRIGGLTFHLASWHQAARDGYVGGCDRARVANLRRVVNNSRFLLLPGLRVPNLASHVLGQVTVRLADDWAAAHGVRPVLAYSYVNAAQRGSCYVAAGWEMAGRVSGVYAGAEVGPMVWMRPLEAAWRRRLCQRPAGDPCWMTGETDRPRRTGDPQTDAGSAPAPGSSRSATGKAISGRCSGPRPRPRRPPGFWCVAMPGGGITASRGRKARPGPRPARDATVEMRMARVASATRTWAASPALIRSKGVTDPPGLHP